MPRDKSAAADLCERFQHPKVRGGGHQSHTPHIVMIKEHASLALLRFDSIPQLEAMSCPNATLDERKVKAAGMRDAAGGVKRKQHKKSKPENQNIKTVACTLHSSSTDSDEVYS